MFYHMVLNVALKSKGEIQKKKYAFQKLKIVLLYRTISLESAELLCNMSSYMAVHDGEFPHICKGNINKKLVLRVSNYTRNEAWKQLKSYGIWNQKRRLYSLSKTVIGEPSSDSIALTFVLISLGKARICLSPVYGLISIVH